MMDVPTPRIIAQVLSSRRLPQHPQPHSDDESSVGALGRRGGGPQHHHHQNHSGLSSAIVDRGEIIEVCVQTPASELLEGGNGTPAATGRTPLILLLMDPSRKLYEVLQLWMDASQDTVRDVLQTINRSLMDNAAWKQDYDGIFQVRNNHFSQLIHVLQAGKYEVVPGEVWVGKPWVVMNRRVWAVTPPAA